MKSGIESIIEERQRQINELGYTQEKFAAHPEDYAEGQLAIAASVYAKPEEGRLYEVFDRENPDRVTDDWPWDKRFFTPTPENRIKELSKAGALIVAEIDRLRLKENPGRTPPAEGPALKIKIAAALSQHEMLMAMQPPHAECLNLKMGAQERKALLLMLIRGLYANSDNSEIPSASADDISRVCMMMARMGAGVSSTSELDVEGNLVHRWTYDDMTEK